MTKKPRKRKDFEVTMGPHTYAVRWVEGLSEREKCWGQAFEADGFIKLDSAMSSTRAMETLIHELIHIASLQHLNDSLKERDVKSLGLALAQALADLTVEI